MASDLVPLSFVAFVAPQQIPGCPIAMLTIEPLVQRLVAGTPFLCPQPYLNPVARTIVVKDREYPLERVSYFTRAKMALSKAPPAMDLSVYTIGAKSPVPSL